MKQVEGGSRISGYAKVELHPQQPKVKVTLEPSEDGAKPKVYVLDKENCPEKVQNGLFIVDLNGEGNKMYSLRPKEGVYKAKIKAFAAKKDAEPAPKTVTGKFGAYQTFAVGFQIIEGKYAGMEVPGSFPYDFIPGQEEIPGKGMQETVSLKKKKDSKHNQRLVELLEVTGVIKMTLPWKENLLPLLQRQMLKADKTFSIGVKEGWVDALFAGED
jgi:hypothetical protein